MAPTTKPITSPPSTALPCASSSASRKIPQPAVTAPSTTTTRSRTFTTASPVTDAARVNVAAELPAPAEGKRRGEVEADDAYDKDDQPAHGTPGPDRHHADYRQDHQVENHARDAAVLYHRRGKQPPPLPVLADPIRVAFQRVEQARECELQQRRDGHDQPQGDRGHWGAPQHPRDVPAEQDRASANGARQHDHIQHRVDRAATRGTHPAPTTPNWLLINRCTPTRLAQASRRG